MTGPTIAAIAIVATILLAVLGYIVKLSGDVREAVTSHNLLAESHCKQLELIPVIRQQLDRLIYRQEMQDSHLIDMLHSPTHRSRDEALRALQAGTLTIDEIEQLVCMLREAKTTEKKADKRLVAALLLGLAETELRKAGGT